MKFACKWCKKEFEDYKCRKDWRKTCSRSCQIKLANTGRKKSKIWKDLEKFVKEYNSGKTFKEIEKEYGIKGYELQKIFQRIKIPRRRVGIRNGEKHYCWKGGLSFEPYSVDWTEQLRKEIRKRDNYTCQICGKNPVKYCHHIDYDKKNCNSDNLITLCSKCHNKTTNGDRDYWKNFLRSQKLK